MPASFLAATVVILFFEMLAYAAMAPKMLPAWGRTSGHPFEPFSLVQAPAPTFATNLKLAREPIEYDHPSPEVLGVRTLYEKYHLVY